MNRIAFLNNSSVVVNVILGNLSEDELRAFLIDQSALFGATSFVIVEDNRTIWIGGEYDSSRGEFSPPPSPEPEPVIVDATSEVIVEETTNVDAPIE